MVQKAVDYETAREVSVAETLAYLGAGVALIEDMTGFGRRWVRSLVRRYRGPLARKPRDPLRWFGHDPFRMLHGWLASSLHQCQPPGDSPGARLANAFTSYRRLAHPPGMLDINECAQFIALVQGGRARLRACPNCRELHLALLDGTRCASCRVRSIRCDGYSGVIVSSRWDNNRQDRPECESKRGASNPEPSAFDRDDKI
jgi:hypothetical protein